MQWAKGDMLGQGKNGSKQKWYILRFMCVRERERERRECFWWVSICSGVGCRKAHWQSCYYVAHSPFIFLLSFYLSSDWRKSCGMCVSVFARVRCVCMGRCPTLYGIISFDAVIFCPLFKWHILWTKTHALCRVIFHGGYDGSTANSNALLRTQRECEKRRYTHHAHRYFICSYNFMLVFWDKREWNFKYV